MSLWNKIVDALLLTAANVLEAGQKPSPVLTEFLLPRPGDVLREKFDDDLTDEDLTFLALQFCGEYDREVLPHMTVHDALHMLLEQPPTADGERKVVSWQLGNVCFDDNFVGLMQILLAALAMAGYGNLPTVTLHLYKHYLKNRAERDAALPKQLLDVPMTH